MSNRTLGWYAAIERPFDQPWDLEHPVLDPIVPWITHSLHPKLYSLIEKIGTPRALKAEEPLIQPGEPVNQVIVVAKGVTGREVGQISGAIAISPPRHIACGNLNFLTSLPCIGRYFALVDSTVIQVPQKLLRGILQNDRETAWLFSVQAELCTLSDRMGFAIYTIPVEDRLKAFFIAWARNYGRFAQDASGAGWCVMPSTVQRKYIASVANTSRVSLDKTMRAWRESGAYVSQGSSICMKTSLLEPVYRWMSDMEDNAKIRRPPTFLEFIRDIEARRQAAGFKPVSLGW